jgi:hypothetical protein
MCELARFHGKLPRPSILRFLAGKRAGAFLDPEDLPTKKIRTRQCSAVHQRALSESW